MEEELNLLHPRQTTQSYVCLLERFWGFYQPLEHSLMPVLEEHWPDFFSRRAKAPSLRWDLEVLGHSTVSLEGLPRAHALPAHRSRDHALGVAYVLEGATLGGAVIARHLEQSFGLTAANGARFFWSYGSDTPQMWRQFCALLTDAEPTVAADRVLAAAQQTFSCMYQWLCVDAKVVHVAN